MGFWRALFRGRIREDRGAYAVLFAIIIVVVFVMVAIVIDLGADRSTVRTNRSYADLAALAGVSLLPDGYAACQASWRYLVLNGAVPASQAGSDPCAPFQGVACTSSTAPITTAPKTIGSTTITFTFPVSDAQLASLSTSGLGTGTRAYDHTLCDRMALDIRSQVTSFFSGVLGSGKLSAPATAVVVRAPGNVRTPVALLLLEPHGCGVLNAGGSGAKIAVHASPADATLGIPPTGGRITADSDGTPKSGDNSCNGANSAIITTSSSSTANLIEAFNTNDIDPTFVPHGPGVIEVYAIKTHGDTTCTASNKACLLADISPPNAFGVVNAQPAAGGATYGVPSPQEQRITRAPFDNTYNCQANYLNYMDLLEVPVLLDPTTCTPGSKPPYINNLVSEIDGASVAPTGVPPGTWTTIGTGGTNGACKNSGGPPVNYSGNIYVNCSTFSVSGGTVNFNNGNVVFQGSIELTGGTLNINTAPTSSATSGWSGCLAKVIGCTNEWSPNATFVYLRPGGDKTNTCGGTKYTVFCVAGSGTTLNLTNTFVYFRDPTVFPYNSSGVNTGACGAYPNVSGDNCTGDDGQLTIKAGASNATMIAPLEGPFKNLAMWNDSTLDQTIGAQGALALNGIFFFPLASVNYAGQGCGSPTNSQFVARTLNVSSSNGCLNMRPTPSRAVNIPIFGPLLIR